MRLGEVYETRLSDSAAALESYERVLERDGSHAAALEAIARLCEKRHVWDRAATALAKRLELATDGSGVAWALRLAAAREALGDAVGVEDALKKGLALEPANTDVRGKLRALYEKGKNWPELASLLVGDADLVVVPIGARPVARPSGPPSRGSVLPPPSAVAGPLLEQVKLLRRAAEIHLKERANPADAVPILERAVALVPTDRELLLVLCDAYSASGRGRDAASTLEKIIASFAGKRPKELALYHHRLGRALAVLGDKAAALAHYDTAFKMDPGSIPVLRDLGTLAFETGDLERAQRTFRALLLQRLDVSSGITKAEVFLKLGEISAQQGDKPRAIQMFERSLENDSSLQTAKARLLTLKS